MQRYRNPLIAISSGLLLWASWPTSPLTFLVFVAWIPLLWLETRVKSKRRFFGLVYITMFVWNVATTWWIWNASPPGSVAAFFANSLLMCFPWLGFKIARKHLPDLPAYASLIAFWMVFEYLHLQDWGLSWPWLTLGNVFASHPEWVQWYSVTGTSGGTCWVLIVNILLFLHIRNNFYRQDKKTYKFLVPAIALLVVPVGISMVNSIHKRAIATDNIVVVQPNIDPYEKISEDETSFRQQLQQLIRLSEEQVDVNTKLLVWPETALFTPGRLDENELKENEFLEPLWVFLKAHPNMKLFTGIESFRSFDKPTEYSQEFYGKHYEAYNGSMLVDSSGPIGFYHKSMLVPGVETLPWFLKFIDKWFEKFGGTTAGYAKQHNRTPLDAQNGFVIAPSICYESIYGEFMSRYVKKGANLICIITNDGWWENTPGHKQHMSYARLRAIETRTWVARSANTGISCFIDRYGTVVRSLPWDTAGAIKGSIPSGNSAKTFFTRNGDILSWLMTLVSTMLVSWTSIVFFQRRRKSKHISND